MHDVRKDLGVDCWLVKILDKLFHLWPRWWCENSVGSSPLPLPHPWSQPQDHSWLHFSTW